MMKFNFSARSFYLSLLLPLLVAACTHVPQQNPESQATEEHEMDAAVVVGEEDNKAQIYPKIDLTGEMLYTFLLADIAAQRGQTELAAQGYVSLATSTRDPRVARRAAQLAFESHQYEQTLEALKLWQELEPKIVMPKQMLATVLLSGGKLEEARPYLVEILEADQKNVVRNFVQLYPLFRRAADKVAAYKMLQDLSKPYLDYAEVHWILSQAAESAGQHEEALSEVRRARALRPEWELSLLLEAQLLKAKAPDEALSVTEKYLTKYPEADDARLFYARTLLEQKNYQESRAQFQRLLVAKPDNSELAFAIALLSIELGEFDRAEIELKQALDAGNKDRATVHYYLGQLHEAKKDYPVAMQEYTQVKEGEYVFPSRLRMAYLLIKAGKLNEAREVLHQTEASNNLQRAQLILSEGQMLREANQYDAAFKVLSKGLETLPNHPDLLYEAAMVAEKQGKPEISEELLRKLIKVSPEHAHAYNALGYSFMERNVHLEEALQLVEKAHQLAPDDPAILDSVGWGHYLTGNLSKSVEYMRRAYAVMPDPEIAAHLGEVLWKQGEREEAKDIWLNNLKNNPDSMALKAVMKKFLP